MLSSTTRWLIASNRKWVTDLALPFVSGVLERTIYQPCIMYVWYACLCLSFYWLQRRRCIFKGCFTYTLLAKSEIQGEFWILTDGIKIWKKKINGVDSIWPINKLAVSPNRWKIIDRNFFGRIFLKFPNWIFLNLPKCEFSEISKLNIFGISQIENFSNFSNLKFLEFSKLAN